MNRLRIVKYVVVAIVVPWGAVMTYFEGRHWFGYGHLAPIALHADIRVSRDSIGIPGITKMYEAILTNYGILPTSVEKCSYTSDISGVFTKVAYNIERWDLNKKEWALVLKFATPDFCTPAPLNMANTHWGRLSLGPGQSLSTEEEATGARDSFEKGESLRFVVVTEVTGPGKRRSSYPTASDTERQARNLSASPIPTIPPCRTVWSRARVERDVATELSTSRPSGPQFENTAAEF